MDSLESLRDELIGEGYSPEAADVHIDALVTHACVCRTRTDTSTGAFREFVAAACHMTRNDRCVRNLHDEMIMGTSAGLAVSAALLDLIMEGVS